jgi:hypothetical protein
LASGALRRFFGRDCQFATAPEREGRTGKPSGAAEYFATHKRVGKVTAPPAYKDGGLGCAWYFFAISSSEGTKKGTAYFFLDFGQPARP